MTHIIQQTIEQLHDMNPVLPGNDAPQQSPTRRSILFYSSNTNGVPALTSDHLKTILSQTVPSKENSNEIIASTENLTAWVTPIHSQKSTSSGHNISHGGTTQPQSTVRPVRRRSVIASEILNNVNLVKRNAFSKKPWFDGIYVMGIVIFNTCASLVVAFVVAFCFAMGSPFTPVYQITTGESIVATRPIEFYAACGMYFSFFHVLAHILTKAYQRSDRLMSFHQGLVSVSYLQSLRHLLFSTIYLVFITIISSSLLMVILARTHIPFREYGGFHLYMLCMITCVFILCTNHKRYRLQLSSTTSLRIQSPRNSVNEISTSGNDGNKTTLSFNPPTVEEVQSNVMEKKGDQIHPFLLNLSPEIPPTKDSPTRRSYHLVVNVNKPTNKIPSTRTHLFIFVHGIFIYLLVSNWVHVTQQWYILLYAAGSLILKISVQEATKNYLLSSIRTPSSRITHTVMTIPTIIMDAHIRMICVQFGLQLDASYSIIGSTFLLVFSKIVFRLIKITRLRFAIQKKLLESQCLQQAVNRVHSKLASRDAEIARAEYGQYLNWRNVMFRLHCAEIYADMHGEYISIGMSMIIIYFLHHHPMYDILSYKQDQLSTQCQIKLELFYASLFQMAIGLIFDYFSSVVEGIHEVPVYETIADEGRGLRLYLYLLLAALTASNVCVIALFQLKSN